MTSTTVALANAGDSCALTVTGTDTLGETATYSSTLTLNGDGSYSLSAGSVTGGPFDPPKIASLSPSSGPVTGGTDVTITGLGFDPTATYTAKFGATSVTATYVSGTTLKVIAPPGTGSVTLTVTDSYYNMVSTGPTFTYYAPPTLTGAFNPSSVAIGAGSQLTLTLANANAVGLTGVGTSVTLPSGLTMSGSAANTCGGTVTATSTSIVLAGGAIPANGTCTITASFSSTVASTYTPTNTSAPVSTEGGNGVVATLPTLTVTTQAVSGTALSASPTNPVFGKPVTLTATVTGQSPTGTVTFYDGTTKLGTGTISNGVATFTTSSLAIGAHSITAAYGGDANNKASTTPALPLTVSKPTTTTTLAASDRAGLIGQPITLTATVAPSSATGTVTFTDGSTVLCANVAVASGVATCVTKFTSAGTHAAIATYGGSATFAGSTSTAVTIAITDQTQKTVQVIGKFLGERNNQILSNGPDAGRQIDRLMEHGDQSNCANEQTTSSDDPDCGSMTSSRFGASADAGGGFSGPTAARGLSSSPLAGGALSRNAANANPMEQVFSRAANDSDTMQQGRFGNSPLALGGPMQLNGSFEGGTRASFSTSLRDVTRFVDDERSKAYNAYGFAGSAGALAKRAPSALDIWVDARFSGFHDSTGGNSFNGHFGMVSVGTDYVFNPRVLAGVMVQFDSMRQTSGSTGSDIHGHGWMAGPYATIRLDDHLYLQGRAAWGKSSNEISPFQTYTDSFDSRRWLAEATLAGRWREGGWTFKPSASLAYIEDTASAYTDTYGVLIPKVKSQLGQLKAGPEVSYRFNVSPNLRLEPRIGAQLIWNLGGGDATADGITIDGQTAGPSGVRGRTELGLGATTSHGIKMDLAGTYDGIGAGGYNAVTGKATLRVPLN